MNIITRGFGTLSLFAPDGLLVVTIELCVNFLHTKLSQHVMLFPLKFHTQIACQLSVATVQRLFVVVVVVVVYNHVEFCDVYIVNTTSTCFLPPCSQQESCVSLGAVGVWSVTGR